MRRAVRTVGIVAGLCGLVAVLTVTGLLWGASVVAAALTALWGGGAG